MMRRAVLFAVAMLITISLCACGSKNTAYDTVKDFGFEPVVGSDYLFYDESTRIIYIMLGNGMTERGYMSAYYDENGKLCRYIDGGIYPIS